MKPIEKTGRRKLVFKASVSIFLLVIILSRIDFKELFSIFNNIYLHYVGLTIVFNATGVWLSVLKWRDILREMGINHPMRKLVSLYFVGFFFNNFMPSMVGGDYVRIVNTASHNRYVQAFSAVLAERATGLMTMLALAMIAAVANLKRDIAVGLEWIILATIFASASGLVLITILVIYKKMHGRLPMVRWMKPINDVSLAIVEVMKDRKVLLRIIIYSVCFHVLLISNAYLFGLSIGLDLDIIMLAVIFPAALLVSMLPISFNGIGVKETSLIVLLAQVGVDPVQGLVIALLSRLFIILASVVGAGIYALEKDIVISPIPRGEIRNV